MLNKKIEAAFNEQIKNELESYYLYLSMAANFEDQGWSGMATWMKKQAQEEMSHAMKFFDYIVERSGRVEFFALAKPQKEWATPLEAFKAAYAHEQFITGTINNLVKLAREEDDNASVVMLNWFVTEQVEEEASALQIVDALEKLAGATAAIFMLDAKLGQR